MNMPTLTALQQKILGNFALDGTVMSCERYGYGHINETYLVTTDAPHRYILQKVNTHVFHNTRGMMENIEAVTSFLKARTDDPHTVLTPVLTKAGQTYLEDGGFFRMYEYVENSLCLQAPECPEDFYESAIAFGSFQEQLSQFPAKTLYETIPNFHNTRDRYRIFRETLQRDPCSRAKTVQDEISFALAREQEAAILVNLLEAGELPLRVTHNDTKLNNVMLDQTTRKALYVIDLDTVMPGLSLYDYGDSIRFGAATAEEDEKDLSKMEMDLGLFRIYTRGYLKACPSLTQKERELLPLGAKLMTLECGVRFLTDFLDGDRYFSVSRENQNLDRARTQFKLVSDMEQKWDEMNRIVREETAAIENS